ncbi:E3 ubiquitin-protein ligase Hul5p [Trichomonascus vanleenenianus]|uniref:ubiquitin-ubiquitin ligase HUL5 n=1 Tax=Trichomonascus vanleenenianus TaxID=2268995 RepID=UPI003ECA6181
MSFSMNFTGDFKRRRNINMAGSGRQFNAKSAQSVMEKAREEREKRERARREEQAATVIQATYRRRLHNQRLIEELTAHWDAEYLSEDNKSYQDALRAYGFILLRTPHPQSDQWAHRLARVRTIVKELHSINCMERISRDTWTLLSSALTTKYLGAKGYMTTAMEVVKCINVYPDREIVEKLSEMAIQYETQGQTEDLGLVLELLGRAGREYPDAFLAYGMQVPDIGARIEGIFNFDDLVERLDSREIALSAELKALPHESAVEVLTNFFKSVKPHPVTLGKVRVFNAALQLMNRELVRLIRSQDEDEYEDEDDLSFSVVRAGAQDVISDTGALGSLASLYTRQFTVDVFRLMEQDRSPETLNVVASLYTTLIRVSPDRRADLTLYLSFASHSFSAVHTFWESFKSTETFRRFSESVQDHKAILSIAGQNEQEWFQLVLVLELYSYWLVVADDTELFNNVAQGLPREEVRHLAVFLKNFVFSLIWRWNELKGRVRRSNAPFKRLRHIALVVMRQIYIRDGRRPFLGQDFWLMTRYVPVREIVQKAAELEQGVAAVAGQEGGAPGPQVDDEGNAWFDIIRHTPFFIPFDLRVQIFQNAFVRDPMDRSVFGLDYEVVTVRRGREFEDGFKFLRDADLKRRLRIGFETTLGETEIGIDGGGLTKEFLTTVAQQAFTPDQGLFTANQAHQLFPDPVWSAVSSGLSSEEQEDVLAKFRFLGKIIGKCLHEGILADVEFASFFLQKSAGRSYRNSFDDLYSYDPDIYNNLVKLSHYTGDVEADLGLNFTVDQPVADVGGRTTVKTIELRPGGQNIPVTNANRLEYIHAVANYKLNMSIAPQSAAFFEGLSQVVPVYWLGMFNATELQMLISGGTSHIDLDDLRRNVEYGRYWENDQTIQDLWRLLDELDDSQRSLFIKFVTSAPKAPLRGFRALNPKFAIHNAGDSERLPTTSTCVNLLKLPDYRNYETLKKKLLYAIHSNAGFDLS